MLETGSEVLEVVFSKAGSEYWFSDSVIGLRIEVIRIDSVCYGSASFLNNPYGEFQYLDLNAEGSSENGVVEAILRKPGLPYALSITNNPNLELLQVYSQVNLRWGSNPKIYVLGSDSTLFAPKPILLKFLQTDENLWRAYYYKTCRIDMLFEEGIWTATAIPLSRTYIQGLVADLSASSPSRNIAVEKLLNLPGIPAVFGFSTSLTSKLKRFVQKFDIQWADRKQEKETTNNTSSAQSGRCWAVRSNCDFLKCGEVCSTCSQMSAAYGWAYCIRWDD
jgi:hypothetical protein